LNLTKSKISAILKEDVGMGFPQYISLLRINEVKRQLVVSQKPIKDIIRGVGYLDVPNFSRRFKSLVGVTPGQYRRLHQAE
jgi:AraC-like DNA-binding protein